MPSKKARRINKPTLKASGWLRVVLGILGIKILLFSAVAGYFVFIAQAENFNEAVAKPDGSVELIIYDFEHSVVTTVNIPPNTEALLAMNRGILRVESIAKLVESENLPGRFLQDSIIKTLKAPVDHWSFSSIGHSSVPIGRRIQAKALLLQGDVNKVNLADSGYLAKVRLPDGGDGYRASNKIPLSLLSILADKGLSSVGATVQIINKTGKPKAELSDVVEVIGVMGGKVATIVNGDTLDIDCSVAATDPFVAARMASVLGCSTDHSQEISFDAQLTLGAKFVERF